MISASPFLLMNSCANVPSMASTESCLRHTPCSVSLPLSSRSSIVCAVLDWCIHNIPNNNMKLNKRIPRITRNIPKIQTMRIPDSKTRSFENSSIQLPGKDIDSRTLINTISLTHAFQLCCKYPVRQQNAVGSKNASQKKFQTLSI